MDLGFHTSYLIWIVYLLLTIYDSFHFSRRRKVDGLVAGRSRLPDAFP